MTSILTFDVSDRPLIAFTGPDRAKSLHNLMTQEIKGLASGQMAEGFVTSPQGKTLGFYEVMILPESILLRCEPGGEQPSLDHFAKYTVFDDVAFEVVTGKYRQRLWLGPDCVQAIQARFRSFGLTDRCMSIEDPEFGRVTIARIDHFEVPGVLLITETDKMEACEAGIVRSSGTNLSYGDESLYRRIRTLAAWPRFAADIRTDNLPQEIDRNATAINFNKGCYLGQETVARLDALGHVNRILRCFVLDAGREVIDASQLIDQPLLDEAGNQVGEIRSAVEGDTERQAAGMALVRVKAMNGRLRLSDPTDVTLTLLTPSEYRERFAELVNSLVASKSP